MIYPISRRSNFKYVAFFMITIYCKSRRCDHLVFSETTAAHTAAELAGHPRRRSMKTETGSRSTTYKFDKYALYPPMAELMGITDR